MLRSRALNSSRKLVYSLRLFTSTARSLSLPVPAFPPPLAVRLLTAAKLPPDLKADNSIVPDFRSTDGLFKGLQKKHNLKASGKLLFDAAVYQDEALTATFHDMVRSLSEESEAAKTSPTEFHHMLARIGQEKRLTRLYSQNIDGIETSLQPLETNIPLDHKNPPPTVQLHGSLDKMVCQKCRCVENLDRQLFENPEAPECHACAEVNANRQAAGYRSHGIGRLRPRIVLYNEHNPDEEAITSIMNADIRSRPDALIVVGTSLKIPGVRHLVKNLCSVIRGRKNGVTMWINNEPPGGKEFEDCWDLVVKGSCDEVAGLANLKRWDDDSKEEVHPCSASEVEDARRRTPSVVVPASKKKQSTLTGLCTPSSSNDEDSLPHKPASNATRPNPASRGRSVADVLGGKAKDPEKASRKSAPKKAPKKPRKKEQKKEPKNSNIKTFNTVTKSASTAPAKGKGEPDKSTLGSIPSNAARNNAPMFPNLRPRKDVTPVLESIPNGMDKLLN